MTRSHRIIICCAATLGVATLAALASAASGALADLGGQAWQSATTSGFAISSPTMITAPAGTYSAGSGAGMSWCSPYDQSSIESAVVTATRNQAASPVALTAGPNPDGSGGTSTPDSALTSGSSGTTVPITANGSACVGAAITQQSIATSPARSWTLKLSDVVLNDLEGPAVSGLTVLGPHTNGWYTGPVTIEWQASDNALLRGTTGVQISAGPSVDLGDAADNTTLVTTLDPGADGPHTITAYRTGAGGWATATTETSINVDRTAPSVPQVLVQPTSTGPLTITTSGSSDGATGSGVARIDLSIDGGLSVLAHPVLAFPGTYEVEARAVDVAGNQSAWSAPTTLTVAPLGGSPGSTPAGAGGRPDPGAVLHLADTTVDGHIPTATATWSLTRTYGTTFTVTGTIADALGVGAPQTPVLISDLDGIVATTTTDLGGRFSLIVPVRRSSDLTLSAHGRGLLTVGVTMRPVITLTAREQRAIHHTPLPLARHRTIVLSGTVQPAAILAGQSLALEYRLGRNWLPLGLPTTIAADGSWRTSYPLTRPGRAVITVRVALQSAPGLPFAGAVSSAVRVAVH